MATRQTTARTLCFSELPLRLFVMFTAASVVASLLLFLVVLLLTHHSRCSCANQIKNAAHEAQDLGVPFVASASDYLRQGHGHRHGPSPPGPCCADGDKKPCPGLPPCGGYTTLEFELALFLLARGSGDTPSYFEYNHDSWSHWPRWSDAETSWAEVQPFYVKNYGAALEGLQERTPNVFTRKFEHVTVRVDCRNQSASFVCN